MESSAPQPGTVEEECLSLKQFLSDVLAQRAALKEELDQLTASSQLIIEQMEDEEDSDEDDVQAEGRLLAYQAEKQRLDEKLRELEEKLKVKDQLMMELDAKASEYLLRVTTSSNSLFDQEESETTSVAVDEETREDPEENAGPMTKPDGQTTQPNAEGEVTPKETDLVSAGAPVASGPVVDDTQVQVEVSVKSEEPVEVTPSVMSEPDACSTAQVATESVGDIKSVDEGSSEPILSLSSLVAELRKVKDEMGKCMTVKEKSFLDLEDELAASRKDQSLLKQQMLSMMAKMDTREKKLQDLMDENRKYKEELENKAKELESAKSSGTDAEKEELENKLKVLELMMVEYRAEIETVTGEKTQVEKQAKDLAKEITNRSEDGVSDGELDKSEADALEDSSGSERGSPDISSADQLDMTQEDDTLDDYSILEEENKKLSEKLRSTSRYLKALAHDREHKRKECSVLQEKVQLVEGKMMQLQGTFDTLVSAVMVERDDLVKEGEAKAAQISSLSQQVKDLQEREIQLVQQANKAALEEEAVKMTKSATDELRASFQAENAKLKEDYEQQIKSLNVERDSAEENLKSEVSSLKNLNGTYQSLISTLKSNLVKLIGEKTPAEESSKDLLVQQLKEKEEECRNLENRIETLNADMNEFVTCLKDEMARMKEDMAKQSEARLQLEVTCDTLTEEHRDAIIEKKKVEETSVELSIALNEQRSIVESLKEQVEDLTSKNTSLSCEFHEKEEEYNEELKAREATIQELKITITKNQKQSTENYRGVQEDMSALQLKMSEEIEEAKATIEQLEQQREVSIQEKKKLEDQIQEALHKYQAEKVEFESAKDDLAMKIKKLEIERGHYRKKMKATLQSLKRATTGQTEISEEMVMVATDGVMENEIGEEEASTESTSSNANESQVSPKELITAWSGTLEELECELSLAKDALVRCSQTAVVAGVSDVGNSADNRTKIASMVRRVEELSGVLAATRLRRGLFVDNADISVTKGKDIEPETEATDTSGLPEKDVAVGVTCEEKGTATWSPFATQEEFEAFVAEKEEKIAELEEKVRELEEAVTSKSSYISVLEEQLEGAREQLTELQNSKSFKDHLDDINRLNCDITKLKEELEQSHGECDGLRSTIVKLETQKSEYEVQKVKVVEELETKLQNALPLQTESQSTDPETEDLELKKKLG